MELWVARGPGYEDPGYAGPRYAFSRINRSFGGRINHEDPPIVDQVRKIVNERRYPEFRSPRNKILGKIGVKGTDFAQFSLGNAIWASSSGCSRRQRAKAEPALQTVPLRQSSDARGRVANHQPAGEL